MKRFIARRIIFFKKEHWPKYLIQIALFAVWLIIFFIWARSDVVSNVIGTVIGFLFSTILLYFIKLVSMNFEDILKVNCDTNYLLQKYHAEPEARKELHMNDTSVTFAYKHCLVNDNYQFLVVDDPDKLFELDGFIQGYYDRIYSAHSNSAKINGLTIRLDRYETMDNLCTFYLSRSTYFNHLLTNRAIDFAIFDDVTLRDIFEFGPKVTPFEHSKMSNHIGINGLVFLNDGNLIVPRRKKDSTISKNKITSSIAVKLNFPLDGRTTIDTNHLMYQNIIDNLSARVKIPPEDLDLNHIRVEFLGFGQNMYEAGKPQFYYVVYLDNIDTATFHKLNVFDKYDTKLDVDKYIYVADYSTYKFEKEMVSFDIIQKDNTRKNIKVGYEMSYLCNLWHYEQWKKKQIVDK